MNAAYEVIVLQGLEALTGAQVTALACCWPAAALMIGKAAGSLKLHSITAL